MATVDELERRVGELERKFRALSARLSKASGGNDPDQVGYSSDPPVYFVGRDPKTGTVLRLSLDEGGGTPTVRVERVR